MEDQTTTTPAAGAPAAATPPAAKSVDPAKAKHEERVKEVKAALASFPTLKEGYVTPRGVYFEEAAALASVDGDAEQVTKVSPPVKKK